MRKMVIRKGIIERYDNIFTDEIVVKGRLIVTGIVRAKKIYGDGIIEAQRINAGSVVADILDVEHIVAQTVIANKILCTYAIVSVGIIAKDYIEAHSVKTARLIAAQSNIDVTEASEIIRSRPKRNFNSVIFFSWLFEHFAIRRHKCVVEKTVKKDERDPLDKKDTEFENLIKSYREKYREGGYRLVLEAVESKAV